MKTAMQIVLDDLLQSINSKGSISYEYLKSKLEQGLETEKQQIIDSYWNGHNQTEYSIHIAETYYNETYKTNKETLK